MDAAEYAAWVRYFSHNGGPTGYYRDKEGLYQPFSTPLLHWQAPDSEHDDDAWDADAGFDNAQEMPL